MLAVRDRAPVAMRAALPRHPHRAPATHTVPSHAPPVDPVVAAPPVAAPALASSPPATPARSAHTAPPRHARRAPPRSPTAHGSLLVPAAAEGFASASAGGGGGGGAGAALAIAVGLFLILVPSGLRSVRLAADGPPAEPVRSVHDRPG
jgi:hypothetical protein